MDSTWSSSAPTRFSVAILESVVEGSPEPLKMDRSEAEDNLRVGDLDYSSSLEHIEGMVIIARMFIPLTLLHVALTAARG